MQTIVVNSQKGGSGKSTLCRVLGVHLARLGYDVALLDFDPQGTVTQWHSAREAEAPKRYDLGADDLAQGLPMLDKHGTDFVLIDTPPEASADLGGVFDRADLVLIPVRPSPDDLRSVGLTVAAVRAANKPFVFVITQAVQNANITAQAVASLSRHGPVAETVVISSVVYPGAFTDGRTPEELQPKGSPGKVAAKLWENVQTYLHANMQSERRLANG